MGACTGLNGICPDIIDPVVMRRGLLTASSKLKATWSGLIQKFGDMIQITKTIHLNNFRIESPGWGSPAAYFKKGTQCFARYQIAVAIVNGVKW